MNTQARLVIIAGPNGAGKTTFIQNTYPSFIAEGAFLNADIFAQELNPDDVEQVALSASKKFLEILEHNLQSKKTCIIETTLSGKSLLNKVLQAKKESFEIHLIFLWVTTPELCDFRVKGRVASGGHNIPVDTIKRRYQRGLNNLSRYLDQANSFEIFQADETPLLICRNTPQGSLEIIDQVLYRKFRETLA